MLVIILSGISSATDRIKFHPYFTSKDLVGFCVYGLVLFSLVFFAPTYLGDSDNSIPANSLSSLLAHIVPVNGIFYPFIVY